MYPKIYHFDLVHSRGRIRVFQDPLRVYIQYIYRRKVRINIDKVETNLKPNGDYKDENHNMQAKWPSNLKWMQQDTLIKNPERY